MTINHIGFDHPPIGLMEMFRGTNVQDHTIWILDPFGQKELPYEEISPRDLIVIYTHEAACHHWFDILLPKLHDQCGSPWNNIAIYSGCLWDPDSPVAMIPNTIDEMTDFLGRYPDRKQISAIETMHHFVCLNRLPRWQRTDLVKKILDLGLDVFGKMSHPPIPGDGRFPLVVDRQDPSWNDGYDMGFKELTHSAVNVITESCYERHPGSTVYESHPRPGISEKTFKTWVLGQFPIWLASYRTVDRVRDLGFDVFDDLIDHSYDLELDPSIRVDLVLQEINRVCQLDLGYWIDARNGVKDRFQNNLDRLWYFNGNHRSSLPIWQKWFDQIS